ncbi:MAG: ribonuclease R [Anaerosomatales bacterium]|nr:ribonuclease R [Anaerosomatales bacterium]
MRPDKLIMKTLRAEAGSRGMTAEEVAAAIERAGQSVSADKTRSVLEQFARSGSAVEVGDGRYLALRERGLLVGRLAVNRRGFGFVGTQAGDIYIRKRDIGGAMHGDTVAVRLETKRHRLGRAGEIVQVVERARSSIVGRFERHGGLGIVVPSDARIQRDVFIDLSSATTVPETGEVVVARIVRYPTHRDAAQGVIEEVLGREDEPGVDVEIVIREHGLRTEFPPDVTEAAEALRQDVAAEIERGREDLRSLFTVTIDPVDAKDFDDAISLERVEGRVRLWVHIADVSHYVPWGSVVDEEARQRATSVYLVDRVLPMLPEHLSNVICSLNPGEERLAFTVRMDLDRNGAVEDYALFPSAIRSDRRFDYDMVQRWLDGGGFPDAESERLLTDFRRVAATLHERRVARGGLDFETVEAKVRLAEDGSPLEVVLRARTDATNMIEEAMILANEVVARHMTEAKAPMVYRIHEDPDPDALEQVAVILKEFDYPIQDVHGASPQTFQRIVKFAHGRPEERLINSLLLRALERARYVDYLGSHFGLASEAYTHFTSPIRRYPDLIVHRLLRAQLAGTLDAEPVASMAEQLEWLTDHCSFMEREAESAEDESTKMKLVELMAEHLGEEFDGIVTGVANFGMFVQLENTAEGLVHVERMADDYYRYDAERFMLWGENRGQTYRLGQAVRVRVVDASVADRRLDFELA